MAEIQRLWNTHTIGFSTVRSGYTDSPKYFCELDPPYQELDTESCSSALHHSRRVGFVEMEKGD